MPKVSSTEPSPPPDAGADLLIAVVRPTPDQEPDRPAPERVAAQRTASRAALAEAAVFAGCPGEEFKKSGERGRPIPSQGGWHWSISHDSTFVAAVVSKRGPLGIDLERIALRRRLLVERVADEQERAALGETPDAALEALGFARLWTSKEAVLKAEQIGLPGLKDCKLTVADGPWLTRLTYRGGGRHVVHTQVGSHLVSLASTAPFRRVLWLRPAFPE